MIGAEMYGDPKWNRMRLGVWGSTDGMKWTKQRTLRQSSADLTGILPARLVSLILCVCVSLTLSLAWSL